jgi:hypothetical protein
MTQPRCPLIVVPFSYLAHSPRSCSYVRALFWVSHDPEIINISTNILLEVQLQAVVRISLRRFVRL